VSNLSYGLFLGCCRVVCLGLRPAAANVSACDLVTVFVFYRGALSAPMPVFIPSSRVSAGFRRPYLGPLCDLLLVFDGEPLIYIFVDSLNVDLEVYIKTYTTAPAVYPWGAVGVWLTPPPFYSAPAAPGAPGTAPANRLLYLLSVKQPFCILVFGPPF
jgi:hypothetical protein